MSDDEPRELKAPSWAERVQRIGFIELFEKYRQQSVHKDTQLPFEPTRKPQAYTIERLAFETGLGMRVALAVFMPIMGLVFAGSFFWDWHGIVRSCSVAGMIGFATNWVAIKMLFWPRESRPIFGQGLIPSQRDQLIEKVADEVLENLINEALILRKVEETRIVERFTEAGIEKLKAVTKDPEFREDVRRMILTYVSELTRNETFRDGLANKAETAVEEFMGPGFRSFLVRRLKNVWRGPLVDAVNKQIEELDGTVDGGLEHIDGILEQLPKALEAREEEIDRVLTRMLLGLVREVDVREIVLEQLATVTPEQLERGFKEFSDDKLSFITLLGGILGVVGGTVIVWPGPSIALMAGALAGLLTLDIIGKRLMESRFWPKRS